MTENVGCVGLGFGVVVFGALATLTGTATATGADIFIVCFLIVLLYIYLLIIVELLSMSQYSVNFIDINIFHVRRRAHVYRACT